MAYKIRAILDVKKDVFRDIIVDETINLEKLHLSIAKSFGFKGREMASFYRTNDNWEQGEEIPLFDMSEDGSRPSMQSISTASALEKIGDKLIYVYDFFSLWIFFIELSEITNQNSKDLPFIALSFGNVPDEAPEKKFIAEKTENDFDEFHDLFENLDDIDLENFE
jgi:hypothetical protein